MESKYSLKKQMGNDYSTLLSLIGFIIVSFFLIGISGKDGFLTLDNDMKIIFVIIFGILDILCITIFILRIKKGRYLIKDGIETEAEIVYVSFYRDRGRIEYIYKIDNEEFKCGNAVHITESSGEYTKGNKIIILVDPRNKRKAVIRSNFIME